MRLRMRYSSADTSHTTRTFNDSLKANYLLIYYLLPTSHMFTKLTKQTFVLNFTTFNFCTWYAISYLFISQDLL